MLYRRALYLSIVYSIPLSVWFGAQLRLIAWNQPSLNLLFGQLQVALILLQVFTLCLIQCNEQRVDWRDHGLALVLITIFPLPFLGIAWLSDQAALSRLLNGVVMVTTVAVIGFLIQLGAQRIPVKRRRLQNGFALAHILIAVLAWNYRDYWVGWLRS